MTTRKITAMNVESQIAILEKEVNQTSELLEKLDRNLERLTDINASINRILAVHDEKLEQQQRKQDDLFALVEQRRQEMNTENKELHSRITTVTREIGDNIAKTEQRIMAGLDELKAELKADQLYHNERQRNLDERVQALERWRYMLVGAGVVGGFVLNFVLDLIKA